MAAGAGSYTSGCGRLNRAKKDRDSERLIVKTGTDGEEGGEQATHSV